MRDFHPLESPDSEQMNFQLIDPVVYQAAPHPINFAGPYDVPDAPMLYPMPYLNPNPMQYPVPVGMYSAESNDWHNVPLESPYGMQLVHHAVPQDMLVPVPQTIPVVSNGTTYYQPPTTYQLPMAVPIPLPNATHLVNHTVGRDILFLVPQIMPGPPPQAMNNPEGISNQPAKKNSRKRGSPGQLKHFTDLAFHEANELVFDRVRMESEMDEHFSDRGVIQPYDYTNVPEMPANPSTVDRLTYEMFMEHARMSQLMAWLETLSGSELPSRIEEMFDAWHKAIKDLEASREVEMLAFERGPDFGWPWKRISSRRHRVPLIRAIKQLITTSQKAREVLMAAMQIAVNDCEVADGP